MNNFSSRGLRVCIGLTCTLGLLANLAPNAFSSPVRRVYKTRQPALTDGAIFKTRSNAGLLSKAQYRDLSRASIELLKRYPPDKHHFVSVGRDAAPFMALLYNLGGKSLVSHCPGSSNSAAPNEQNFKKYGDKFLPTKEVLGNRTVVLVDMTRTGRGLASYQPHITKYIKSKSPKTKVTSVAFSSSSTTKANHTINTAKFQDVNQYAWGSYENDIAPFDRHPIHDRSVPPKGIKKEFYTFAKAVLQRMERDGALDKFLKASGVLTDAQAATTTKAKAPPKKKAPKTAKAKAPPKKEAPTKTAKAKATPKKTTKKTAAKAKATPPTRGQRWGVQSPYIAGLAALPRGAQLKVQRTIKGTKHAYSLLAKKDYTAYSRVVQQLTKMFPLEKGALYVGVGRSTTPIFAMLEALDPQRAAYLPIDNASGLTSKDAAAINKLVKTFLPASGLKNSKTVVIYQKGTGTGLAKVKPLLQRALKSAGYNVTIKAVALHNAATPRGVARIDTSKSAPLQALDGPEIKAVAPITRHHVGKHKAPVAQYRSKFGKLQRTMNDFMQRDLGLDKFLNSK